VQFVVLFDELLGEGLGIVALRKLKGGVRGCGG
jgi:hypothetical protein